MATIIRSGPRKSPVLSRPKKRYGGTTSPRAGTTPTTTQLYTGPQYDPASGKAGTITSYGGKLWEYVPGEMEWKEVGTAGGVDYISSGGRVAVEPISQPTSVPISTLTDPIKVSRAEAERKTISEWKEPTKEQQRESLYLQERYRETTPTFISKPLSVVTTGIKKRIVDPFSFFIGGLVGKKPTPEREALQLIGEPTYGFGAGGTVSYRLPTTEELSPIAGYRRTAVEEELVAAVDVETKIGEKRTEILKRISPDGITEQEARIANIELEKFHTKIIKESEKKFGEREEVRQQSFFPPGKIAEILPEWKFDPERLIRGISSADIPGIGMQEAKISAGALTFASGFYRGIREKPVKTALTAAAFVALPVGFKVVSGIGKAAKIGSLSLAYPKTADFIGKGVRYGMGGVYGTTVAGRIALAPGFEKYGVAGEIVSTELLPMGLGWKVGAYGVRRYEAVTQLKEWAGKLPSGKKALFEKQIIEATAFGKIEPSVKEISLGKMEYIPKKAEKPLMEFIKRRKRDLIVGGRVAEYTQIYPTPKALGHDVDIYLKGILPKIKGRTYTRELAEELRMAGVERVAIPPKHPTQITIKGKKAIEFHPYKEYLRYNIEQVLPWYKPATMGITTTPSGIKVMKLPVQWKRMIVRGYFEKSEALGRAKTIRESMMESARIQKTEKFPQLFSLGEFKMPLTKSVKGIKTGFEKTGLSIKPKKVKEYPYYKAKFRTPFYPGYKPSKDLFGIPYKPITKKEPIPYLPTKPYKPMPYPKREPPRAPPHIPYKPIKEWIGGGFYEEIMPTPPKKKKPMRPGRLPGAPDFSKSIFARRKFIPTPSLADVMRFELGYKVPKTPKAYAQTGLIGFGIGEKLPQIELGSLLGKVTRTKKKINNKKTKGGKKK